MKTLRLDRRAPWQRQNMLDAVIRITTEGELAGGAHWSSLDELTAWTLEADRVLAF